jgi:hypothetical protein
MRIDAPSGLMRWDERWLGKDGPTRFAQTRPANLFERSPHGPDGRLRTMGDEYCALPKRKEPEKVIYSDWQGCMGRPLFPILRMNRKNPSCDLACGLSAGLLLSSASKYLAIRDRYPVREIQENGVKKREEGRVSSNVSVKRLCKRNAPAGFFQQGRLRRTGG